MKKQLVYGMKFAGYNLEIDRTVRRGIFFALLGIITFFATITASAQSAQELISAGDALVKEQFANQKALEKYKAAEKLEPHNYDALWRISRALVDIAEHLPDKSDQQKDAQLDMYNQALSYAEKTVKINPNGMMGYLRRSIANGRVALFKGVFSVVGLVKDVKSDVEKAIRLNNETKHELAVAHYVLARTHAKVCDKPYLLRLPLGLGWGDREIAADHYESAIAIDPDFIMFRLDAARNYIEMDEYQKAKDHLYKIPQLSRQDEDDDQFKKDAAELLRDIKNK